MTALPLPGNRLHLTLGEIAEATGGQIRSGRQSRVEGVVTDSRLDVRNRLFVALSGQRFDGHDCVDHAIRGGAAAVMVSRNCEVPNEVSVVRVPSTLQALGALGRWWRKRWGGAITAVAGSAGKTTTRSAAGAMLGAVFPGSVHTVSGNFNNLIGVPLVLLGIEPEHRYAVVELGTSRPGEVSDLVGISEPDAGILTLIGLEHCQGFGGIDQIEKEEGELLAGLGPGGVAVANGDDVRAQRQLAQSPAFRKVSYGFGAECDYRVLSHTQAALDCAEIAIERRGAGRAREVVTLSCSLFGRPGALAAAAALALVDALLGEPIAEQRVSTALKSPELAQPGRLVPIQLADGSVILDDSYNSNPPSLLSSLEVARELAHRRSARLLLVLGEMRELGEHSRAQHRAMGERLGANGAESVIAVGGDAQLLADSVRAAGVPAEFAGDSGQALELVIQQMRAGDVVLVKGSRGLELETVVEGLIDKRGKAS